MTKAQIIKKQLEALELLSREIYRWITDLNSLAVLHIDKSAKIKISKQKRKVQTYAAFLIVAGEIIERDDFKIEETPALYDSLKEKLSLPRRTFAEPKQLAEKLSIAAYYLYRSNPPGIWLKCREIASAGEITKAIRKKFEE